jgi:hypothetical protein
MQIAIVIVTYNRLSLLKECFAAVQNQSHKSDKIIIVNNSSTDGTDKYLSSIASESVECINLERNIGGAGGFSRGIKQAVSEGYDYVWIMDDDCIPQPEALANLAKAFTLADNVGFAASKVMWTDDTPHKMNMPRIAKDARDRSKMFNDFSTAETPAIRISNASFVSLMVSAKAVHKVGLPIAEFFIWHDDTEFTERITRNGFVGLYVDNSIVLHKTATNYFGQPQTAPTDSAWKFYYQARNTTYIKRMQKRKNIIVLIVSAFNNYRVFAQRVNKRKTADKAIFKQHYRKGLWDGLFFNPEIEKI